MARRTHGATVNRRARKMKRQRYRTTKNGTEDTIRSRGGRRRPVRRAAPWEWFASVFLLDATRARVSVRNLLAAPFRFLLLPSAKTAAKTAAGATADGCEMAAWEVSAAAEACSSTRGNASRAVFLSPRIRIRRADPSSPRDVASAAPVPPPPPPPPPPTPTPRRSHPRDNASHCARAPPPRVSRGGVSPRRGPVGRPDGAPSPTSPPPPSGPRASTARTRPTNWRATRRTRRTRGPARTGMASRRASSSPTTPARGARARPGGRRRPRVHECRRVVVVVVVAFVIVDTLYRPCLNPVYTLLFSCLLCLGFPRL